MYQIQRMGCACRHDSSFILDQPQGFEGYLMLFVRTPAYFRIGDREYTVEPETFILYDRGVPLYYGASGGSYVNDWILFDCTDPLSKDAAIRFNEPVFIGEQINLPQYFQLIADGYYRGTDAQAAGLLIRAMLSEIFSQAERSRTPDFPHYRELLDLRRQIYAQPARSWNVKEMAQMLSISVPYLHALYKKAFGITCTGDVIRSRMEQAQQYLRNRGMTVEEIAFACGYSSCVHFSRQFKQQTGLSPLQWRRQNNT